MLLSEHITYSLIYSFQQNLSLSQTVFTKRNLAFHGVLAFIEENRWSDPGDYRRFLLQSL